MNLFILIYQIEYQLKNNSICHKPLESELELKKNFYLDGKINVGITSGASTPDKVVADVIEKLIDILLNLNINFLLNF